MKLRFLAVLILVLLPLGVPAQNQSAPVAGEARQPSPEIIKDALQGLVALPDDGAAFDVLIPQRTKIEKVERDGSAYVVTVNDAIGERPWSLESKAQLVALMSTVIKTATGEEAPRVQIMVQRSARGQTRTYSLDDYVTSPELIQARQAVAPTEHLAEPVVSRPDYAGPERTQGLAGKHLIVSPSHGWTWHKENRWQLQRARVYTVVEDLYTQSYINPFLVPMLENAGAVVFMTRERDYNTAEVIVDNDVQSTKSRFLQGGTWELGGDGWLGGRPVALRNLDQPFTMGTSLRALMDPGAPATATFVPYIPRSREYAVYMSWDHLPNNSPSVPVTVRHAGGETTVRVNQQVAGSTWVYIGTWFFEEEANEQTGSVTITSEGAAAADTGETFISADAVKFGGGMGNISPDDLSSGKPRYAEAARYWTQYAGAPPDLVYNTPQNEGHFHENYNQDITARGEFANYIQGTPNGPNFDRDNPGLGVPIDAMLSWHTDAGGDEDGLIGTLSIYSVRDDEGNDTFPDGRSRFLNRDLMSLIHSEIARTAREQYTSTWAMRRLWDTGYGEARRPNMPAALLELLSHHNFNDMKYGTDPRFKRDMSRAIYRAIVRFVGWSNGYDPVIQPLQPANVYAKALAGGRVQISWTPVEDELEPTATPDGYIVYTSEDGNGFDNGRYVEATTAVFDGLKDGQTYYFKVTAANAGGESLPTSTVGVCSVAGRKPVLIVDGFDRISGAEILDEEDAQGFMRQTDPGVGYHNNYGICGNQVDFNFDAVWYNDLEGPGRGASRSNMEDRLEPGNLFNHVVVHGREFARMGQSFDSATSSAWSTGAVDERYGLIDWVAGEQRTVAPYEGIETEGAPDRMSHEFEVIDADSRRRLRDHVGNGGKLLISGAYVAEDLMDGPLANDDSRAFAREILGIDSYIRDSTAINSVRTNNEALGFEDLNRAHRHFVDYSPRHLPSPPWKDGYFPESNVFNFGQWLDQETNVEDPVYWVEQPESFWPSDDAETIFEYGENGDIAGYATENVIVLGFPIETVVPIFSRTAILEGALVRFSAE